MSENRAVYEIYGKMCRVRQATDDNIMRCMHFVCWINKAVDTNSEYVIFVACPRTQ